MNVIVPYLQQLGQLCITVSVRKQVSLEGFTKNLGRVNAPDVGRNEVPDLWTTGGERALPELVIVVY